ncbi:hypothetical protein QAD02_019777 [Eretmocerus hayati]|uniref:Uncharacterized protein n=1 Tax=Eretmocerus hayati TaxID=131215 RepID=A0ACC2PQC8_9HYME|nr:hypothetical protein QAD02_019777 [Eretmocerus hayati]
MVDITRDKPIKVAVRVQVPVRDHPKFNFVGKLLGPKGNSLKRLQEDTMCKMAVLGRGSMKDRQKEEELRLSGDPKFSHLMEDLHVEISAYATPAEAHARIAYALAEVRRFLVPDYNDDIRQEQMWEMQILNTQHQSREAVEAPLSPASSLEAANSPTAATTANSIDGHEDGLSRPSPSPPSCLKSQPSVLPAVTSTLGGRKRPLLPGARPAMSPTKRTVMSLLARARAAQHKELQQPGQQQSVPMPIVGSPGGPPPPSVHQQQVQSAGPTLMQQPNGPCQAVAVVTTQHQLQLAAAAQSMQSQRQPPPPPPQLMQSHAQHPAVLAPAAIHGLLHAQ